VGGWTPDLLLPDADVPHVGSIDVDIALDAAKLNDGRYAELLHLLLDTKRYRRGEKDFQLVVEVDLKDGKKPVQVALEFLAPKEVKLKKRNTKLLTDFRVLQIEAASEAFRDPVEIELEGRNVRGAGNKVHLRIVSLAHFLVMKAHAIGGRDKPKDTYDLCYCLDHYTGSMKSLAEPWKRRIDEANIAKAVRILQDKFASVDAFGPQQLVEFHGDFDVTTQEMQARRAFQLVQNFLSFL
ncbi:MAG: nucleotidyl transferase AbiEii/AbiGii toxin family protein, partial [Planctomycetota bacterium]